MPSFPTIPSRRFAVASAPNRRPRLAITPVASALFAVVGVTRDAAGSALGGMYCYLFRAGSMEVVSQGFSDGAGNYSLPTPGNAGYFVVVSFHPDGSLAGITRPVLVASQVG